jgi:hypothetical protein
MVRQLVCPSGHWTEASEGSVVITAAEPGGSVVGGDADDPTRPAAHSDGVRIERA